MYYVCTLKNISWHIKTIENCLINIVRTINFTRKSDLPSKQLIPLSNSKQDRIRFERNILDINRAIRDPIAMRIKGIVSLSADRNNFNHIFTIAAGLRAQFVVHHTPAIRLFLVCSLGRSFYSISRFHQNWRHTNSRVVHVSVLKNTLIIDRTRFIYRVFPNWWYKPKDVLEWSMVLNQSVRSSVINRYSILLDKYSPNFYTNLFLL